MARTSTELSLAAQTAALTLFNVLPAKSGALNASHAAKGFVTDFTPSSLQLTLLQATFKPINLVTLYTQSEATENLEHLFVKQVLHYLEVYDLREPGLFNLEVKGGKSTVLRFVKAATPAEIVDLVSKLLHTDAPIADVTPVVTLVRELNIAYQLDKLPNRELRIALFNPETDVLGNGDDAVRWLCWRATGNTLLIKDPKTVRAVQAFAFSANNRALVSTFLGAHAKELAQVFNRHKKLLIPLKAAGGEASRLVNRLSRLSKRLHVPVGLPASRTVIARAARGEAVDLARSSLRDKFRYLNLIEYKLLGLPIDVFAIRNGKLWRALDRPVLDAQRLVALRAQVLESLKDDLAPLRKQRILLDAHVDYGLPISRKQTLGNLPFGTALCVEADKKISVGIYWRNEWGATDLDLSALTEDGERIGWGSASSYGREDITFSGDVTDAREGACEFMTVDPSIGNRYGLMVNIYSGEDTAETEIIAGYPRVARSRRARELSAAKVADSWQDRTLLREKITLTSNQTLIGFLRGDRFVIFSGRLSSARVSGGRQPVVARGLTDLWTVGKLFKAVGVSFDTEPQLGMQYAHDLRYRAFSLDKLERMFELGKESS